MVDLIKTVTRHHTPDQIELFLSIVQEKLDEAVDEYLNAIKANRPQPPLPPLMRAIQSVYQNEILDSLKADNVFRRF